VNFNGSILLVDDEAHIRKFISLLLRHLGVDRIFEARNGVEAIEVYKKDSPDLVMLDVNMPVMDGIETLRALKALNPDCVVVMLTSLANRQTIDDAAALGAANYIRKDAPPEDIGRALSDTIDSCFEFDDSEAGTPPPET
jgi:two-component system chemotaxis response regulator CheY